MKSLVASQQNNDLNMGISNVPLEIIYIGIRGFPGGASSKESACQCRRHKKHGFDPLVMKLPWSKKWQPTAVFFPGKFHVQRSLVGYSPWNHKELDTTEQPSTRALNFYNVKPFSLFP